MSQPLPARRFRTSGSGLHSSLVGLVLSALLGGCGPTDQEIAVTLVTSIAIAVPIAAAINFGLYRLWRTTRRDLLAPSWLEAVFACAVAAAVAIGVNVRFARVEESLLAMGLWLAGASYLALFSLALLIALWRRARWGFRGLFWAPAALATPFLAPIVADVRIPGSYKEAVFVVVLYTGGLGVVGGGLFLALLIRSVVVYRRERSAATAPP